MPILKHVKSGKIRLGKHTIYYSIDRGGRGVTQLLFMRSAANKKYEFQETVQAGITSTALRQYAQQYLRRSK